MENQNQPLDQQNDQEQNTEEQNQGNAAGDSNTTGQNQRTEQNGNGGSSGVVPDDELEGSDADVDPGMRDIYQERPGDAEGNSEQYDEDEEEDLDIDESTGGTAV